MKKCFAGVAAFVMLILLFEGCETHSSLTGRNLSNVYTVETEAEIDQMQAAVFHLGDGRAKVSFKLPESFLVMDDEGAYAFSMRYKLYQNYSSVQPIDSGHHEFLDVSETEVHKMVSEFEMNIPAGRNYMLELMAVDLNSSKKERIYVTVVNATKFSNQSFEVSDMRGRKLMQPVLAEADSYLLVFNEPQEVLIGRMYERNFPMASPPFSAINNRPFNFQADGKVRFRKLSSTEYLIYVTRAGIYQISDDSTGRDGAALYFFGAHFPKAKTLNDLLFPLRYITTSNEYKAIAQGENIKKEIDNYWLKIGGNPDRARILIQAYYRRVEISNRYFSSYMEGWKTDRGMCYLVFGPPTKVYRATSSETWIYGEEGKYSALTLTFTKVSNPFTSNDFRLNRSASLKSPWYRAVEFWRQGRVITYQ